MTPESKNISLKGTLLGYPLCGKKELALLEQYSFGSHLPNPGPYYSYVVKVVPLQCLSVPRVSQCGVKVGSYR